MDIVIITGMSGAGKTSVVNMCQDNDYYSIDNLPPKLIVDYLDFIEDNGVIKNKIAFVTDIRLGEFLLDLEPMVEELRKKGHSIKVIFVDATNQELVTRFQEKRRPHFYDEMPLEDAILKERNDLSEIKKFSDKYIDTTDKSLSELQSELLDILEIQNIEDVKIISFGFKYGQLMEADYIFDVRFLDNPYYNLDMRHKTGKEKIVSDYVLSMENAKEFLVKVEDLLEYIIPKFRESGKSNLVIGVGCTGGKHRSVAIAEELNKRLEKKYNTKVFHREEK